MYDFPLDFQCPKRQFLGPLWNKFRRGVGPLSAAQIACRQPFDPSTCPAQAREKLHPDAARLHHNGACDIACGGRPIELAPTFLAVTEGLPRRARDVAARASLIAGANLIGTALLGDLLLRALGLSLSAFHIAGGLLLFAIAFEMVLGVRMRREGQAAEEAVEEHVRNIAAFPLAIPLMAGAGAITATVLLAGRAYGQMLLVGLLLAV